MGLRKKTMMMKVMALVLFLMAVSATVEARFDAEKMLAQTFNNNGEPNFVIKSTTTACCDKCVCTKSSFKTCECHDIGESDHSACNICLCTFSSPTQCQCMDTTTFCYPTCSSSAKPQIAEN